MKTKIAIVDFLCGLDKKGIQLSADNTQAAAIAIIKVFGTKRLTSLHNHNLIAIITKAARLGTSFDDEVKKIESSLRTLAQLRDFASFLDLKIIDIKNILEEQSK